MICSCDSKIVLQSICCNQNKTEPNIRTSEQSFLINEMNNFDVGNNIYHCSCLKLGQHIQQNWKIFDLMEILQSDWKVFIYTYEKTCPITKDIHLSLRLFALHEIYFGLRLKRKKEAHSAQINCILVQFLLFALLMPIKWKKDYSIDWTTWNHKQHLFL